MKEFREESLSKAERQNRSSNMGELRIIASIIDDNECKSGFIVMVERTGKTKPYTYAQVMALLSKYTFVNACKKDGKVQILDSALDRLPTVNMALQLVDYTKKFVIVKSELYSGNKFNGYRVIVLDSTGLNFIDLDEESLVALVNNRGYKLVNAKLVTRGSRYIVSAIKGEFLKEQVIKDSKEVNRGKSKNNSKITAQSKLDSKTLYRYNRHSNKLKCAAPSLFKIIVYKHNCGDEALIMKRLSKRLGVLSKKQLSKEEELLILINETLSTNKDLKKDLVNIHKVVDNSKVPFVVKAAMVLQYFYKDGDISLEDVSIDSLCVVNKLKDLGVARPDVLKLISDVTIKSEAKLKNRRLPFEETQFIKATQIAELGFAISKNNEGISYKTKCGATYKLKYIGNYIEEYDKYKAYCTSLGDMMSMVVIEKSLHDLIYEDLEQKYVEAQYGKAKSTAIARIEIALCMLAFYNFELAKKYYTETLRDKLAEHKETRGIGIDFDKFVDLDQELKTKFELYYTSGYCVTDNIGSYIDSSRNGSWKLDYLKESKYINVRHTLSIKTPAIFETDIKNMICAVINTNVLKSNTIWIDETLGLMRVI